MNPIDMTRNDWNSLLGVVVTLFVSNPARGIDYMISGTLTTIRSGVGEVVLEDATKTRLSGHAAGTAHRIARRAVGLVEVTRVISLTFLPAA